MKKVILSIIELICIILIPTIIIFQLYIGWKYIYESVRYEIKINDNNREIIEQLLETSEYENLDNVEKIQFIEAVHHDKYAIYYNNGSKAEFINNEYKELRHYIIENGKTFAKHYAIIFVGLIFLIIFIIILRIIITKKINKID